MDEGAEARIKSVPAAFLKSDFLLLPKPGRPAGLLGGDV